MVALLLAFGGGVSQSQAGVTAVASPGALPTTDTIGWSQLGSTLTPISTPVGVTSVGGLSATVSDGSSLVTTPVQGTSWAGDFPVGDILLYNLGNGPISIDFASPVYGAGAYIESHSFGDYTAVIAAAYDGGTLLGSESFSGISSPGTSRGYSAVFAGLESSSADITEVIFSLSAAPGGDTSDFAIDTLDLNGPPIIPAPDAGCTSWLLGMAFLGLGIFRKNLVKS